MGLRGAIRSPRPPPRSFTTSTSRTAAAASRAYQPTAVILHFFGGLGLGKKPKAAFPSTPPPRLVAWSRRPPLPSHRLRPPSQRAGRARRPRASGAGKRPPGAAPAGFERRPHDQDPLASRRRRGGRRRSRRRRLERRSAGGRALPGRRPGRRPRSRQPGRPGRLRRPGREARDPSCAPRPYPAAYEPESLGRCRADFRAAAEAAAERRRRAGRASGGGSASS